MNHLGSYSLLPIVLFSSLIIACAADEPFFDRDAQTPATGDVVDVSTDGAHNGDTDVDVDHDATASQGGTGGHSGGAAGMGGNTGGTGGQAGGTEGGAGGSESVDPYKIRVVAANLTSGNGSTYNPGHGKRILQGLKPDIILIQELNYGSNTVNDIHQFVSEVCGNECSWTRGNGKIPNGIISRYPIMSKGNWHDKKVNDRDFSWAHIDLPGPKDLWAISVHLLTSNAGDRNSQANQIMSYIDSASIAQTDYVVLGGDFNTDRRSETCLTTFSKRFVKSAPYPTDQNNNGNTNKKRGKPYDWVLASTELHKLHTPLIIGESTYDHGLVFDSRVYTPLSEVTPVEYGDSGASQMQHMAVARDFLIQQ